MDWSGVIDNKDGSYVITCTLTNASNSGDITCLPAQGGTDLIWLIQLRDTLFVSTPHLNLPNNSVKVYPNPASEYVVFELQKPLSTGAATLTITDITGRPVTTLPLRSEKTVWQTENAKPGVYLYRISHPGGNIVGKILLE